MGRRRRRGRPFRSDRASLFLETFDLIAEVGAVLVRLPLMLLRLLL
ncbi:hypothetical protein [Brachybacterium saurashtrense]|nr:hypothetical protein [Brachybacterium saurashtrense]